jgi:hypothetical protein
MEKPGFKPGVFFRSTKYQLLAPQARIKYETSLQQILSGATKKSAMLCLTRFFHMRLYWLGDVHLGCPESFGQSQEARRRF